MGEYRRCQREEVLGGTDMVTKDHRPDTVERIRGGPEAVLSTWRKG